MRIVSFGARFYFYYASPPRLTPAPAGYVAPLKR